MVSAIDKQVFRSEEFVELISGRYSYNKPVFRRFIQETMYIEPIAAQETLSLHSSNEINEINLHANRSFITYLEADVQNEVSFIDNAMLENENIILQNDIQSTTSVSSESSSLDLISKDSYTDIVCVNETETKDCEKVNKDMVIITNEEKTEKDDNFLNTQDQDTKKNKSKITNNFVSVPEDCPNLENNDARENKAYVINYDKHPNQIYTHEINERNENNDISDEKDIKIVEKNIDNKISNAEDKNSLNEDLENIEIFNKNTDKSKVDEIRNNVNPENNTNNVILNDNKDALLVINRDNVDKKETTYDLLLDVRKEDKKVNEIAIYDSNALRKVEISGNIVDDGTKAQIKNDPKCHINQTTFVHNVNNTGTLEYIAKNINDLTAEEIKLKKILNEIVLDDEDDFKINNVFDSKKIFEPKTLHQKKKVEKKIEKDNIKKVEKIDTVPNNIETIEDVKDIKDPQVDVKDLIINTNLVVSENVDEPTPRGCFSGILNYLKNFF
ncbi:hypothetical protein COBT_000196 [Conglomerata obtusa]